MLSLKTAMKKIVQCFEYLPSERGLEYIILKGHLLAEEEMLNYIKRAMPNPISITEERFSFYQLIQIVKAMRPTGADLWLWEALQKLNSLRNEMAHNLQPQGFDRRVKQLIKIIEQKAGKDNLNIKRNKKEKLRNAITVIVAHVYALPQGRKKYPNT